MAEYIRVGDTLTNIINSKTKEVSTYTKVTLQPDNVTPIDDAFIGLTTPIYRKLGIEYFKLNYSDTIDVRLFGAVGDNIADDTAALQRASDVAYLLGSNPNSRVSTLLFPTGYIFRITDTLNIKDNINVEMKGQLFYAGTQDRTALSYGTPDVASRNNVLKLNIRATRTLTSWDNTAYEGIRLTNLDTCDVYIEKIDGFYKGLVCMGDKAGFAYNKVYLQFINSNKYGVYQDTISDGENIGWCNENKFYGGRFTTTTGYLPGQTRVGVRMYGDDNIYYSPSFELSWQTSAPGFSQAVVMDRAFDSKILNCRNEGNSSMVNTSPPGPAFIINNDSRNNVIEVAYTFDRQRAREANALQDNSETKQNRYISSQNLYAEAQFGRTIYDSGNLGEKSVRYANNQITCSGMLFADFTTGVAAPISPIVGDVDAVLLNKGNGQYVELKRNAFAVRLTTDTGHKFAVIRSGLSGSAGQIGVKFFDDFGEEITSSTTSMLDTSVEYNQGVQTFAYSTNYGGCYLTGTPTPSIVPVYFSVKPEVKSILLLIGSPSGFTRLKSFQVLSLENEAKSSSAYSNKIYSDGLKRVSTLPPTSGTYDVGQLLFSRLPSSGDDLIYNCSRAGTAHAIAVTGNVTTGSRIITGMSSVVDLNVGDYVLVATAVGVQYFIERIYPLTNTIWLNSSTGLVTGTALAITNDPPVFVSGAKVGFNFAGTAADPNGVITALQGSTYQRKVSTGSSSFWFKATNADNTGWIPIITSDYNPMKFVPIEFGPPTVTLAYLNTNYPVASYPIGTVISFRALLEEYRREATAVWSKKTFTLAV